MKIAIAQINPIIADIDGNREKIINCIKKAKADGAELVVFPEMATIGYPPMDLLENSKLINDNLASLEKIAGECDTIAAIVGFVDYDKENPPMLFNSAAFLNEGKIKSKHNKTLLPSYDIFDERRYFNTTRVHQTVEYKNQKIGITVCEDIWNALYLSDSKYTEQRKYQDDPVAILTDQGIEILINISASPFIKGKHGIKQAMLQETAEKHGITLVYVNQVGGNDSVIFDGKSMAINKAGEIIGKGVPFREDFVSIDTDGNTIKDEMDDELEDIKNALTLGIRDYLFKCGFKMAVIGLSGGIDSALTAALAVEALGKENVMGITMPSKYSSQGSVDDSMKLAENLGITIETVSIKELYNQYLKDMNFMFRGLEEDTTEENIQARIRGNILMAVSNKTGRILLSTGNKSELSVGYCTLYGDMCGGLSVISDLSKTLVYKLSRYINREQEIIPVETIEKPPSAELKEDQKDQDSLPPYDVLDRIIELYIEERKSSDEIIAEGFEKELVLDILHKVRINEYKRVQAAPGLKVTIKAFGTGRRIPIAQKYKP